MLHDFIIDDFCGDVSIILIYGEIILYYHFYDGRYYRGEYGNSNVQRAWKIEGLLEIVLKIYGEITTAVLDGAVCVI